MGWNYITSLKTDIGSERELLSVLKHHFKTKYDIELPEDFGPCGSMGLPNTDSQLNLFGSPSVGDVGTLIVVEDLTIPRTSTEFYIYGDLVRLCVHCNEVYRETNFNHCPKCGSKLTHELW